MGEVYRANDLQLGQPVALKFVTRFLGDPRTRERLRNEVKLARQISHANVSRVYDIGEAEGELFLSMEYVDGENLGTLLRRIGRLPIPKGIEIARKLCAGLSAAHANGVLHRDLKPANIMIDSAGEVSIMDFGLAALREELDVAESRSGTPAYMAPEQLAGREVTIQSDLYALGLVLYEMFTGKAPFEANTLDELLQLREGSHVTKPSTVIPELEPALERTILRCLDPDPKQRPASALMVAASLPGGNLLAEALAAGETPSPDMIAASRETTSVSVRTLMICVALIVLGIGAVVRIQSRGNVVRSIPRENSPEVLAQKARELIQKMGYGEPALDQAYSFNYYDPPARRTASPENPQSSVAPQERLYFWYRQSPRYLSPLNGFGIVSPNDPPVVVPGMLSVDFDAAGRLTRFSAVSSGGDVAERNSQPDWAALVAAAGLDFATLNPTEPQLVPLSAFDTRFAWTGSHANSHQLPIQIEAASWRGKPVSFELVRAWSTPQTEQVQKMLPSFTNFGFAPILVGLAVMIAWWNHRRGRGDSRGALRLATIVGALSLFGWMLTAKHTPTIAEYYSFTRAVSSALGYGAAMWAFYMALEPYVRRHWPQSIITWTRLLRGAFHDPLVSEHVVIGSVFGIAVELYFLWTRPATAVLPLIPPQNVRATMGALLGLPMNAIGFAMMIFFLFFVLRLIFRRDWLAALAYTVLFFMRPGSDFNFLDQVLSVAVWGIALFVIMRFGLLAMVVSVFVTLLLDNMPLTTDLSAWYADSMLCGLAVLLAIVAYAFRTAVASRSALRSIPLD